LAKHVRADPVLAFEIAGRLHLNLRVVVLDSETGIHDLIVKLLRLARKVGNEKSRIGPLFKVLGLNDNATLCVLSAGLKKI